MSNSNESGPQRYTLTNEEPGPRGVQTVDSGIVMVPPSAPGSASSMTAVLTDDEVKLAKSAGLKVAKVNEGDDAIVQSENLPAEGQVDVNAPDAAKLLAGNQRRQSAQDDQPKQTKQG